jgi:PAT family beta-lactamase induction signal transducer AmpG
MLSKNIENNKLNIRISLRDKLQASVFFLLGFASGLPFLLIVSSLALWFSELGASKTMIGGIIFLSIPYSLKPLWASFVDLLEFSLFNNSLYGKHAWGLLANIGVVISIIGIAFSRPDLHPEITMIFAFLVCFCAATQDICVDTLRIQAVPDKNIGFAAAMEAVGFRCGMITSGAGALYLAEYLSWSKSYMIMAWLSSLGSLGFVILSKIRFGQSVAIPQHGLEEIINQKENRPSGISRVSSRPAIDSISQVCKEPYFLSLICLIFFFKLPDSSLNSMIVPLVHDLGFSKIEYADIAKIFGTCMMILGSTAGGYMVTRYGTVFTMKIYIISQILLSCIFIIQTFLGRHYGLLTCLVALSGLVSGMGSVAFLSYLVKFCKSNLTATNFTLFSSFGSMCRVLISFASAILVDLIGWYGLFAFIAVFSLGFLFALKNLERYFHGRVIS